jgi:hypothetical protein
MELNKETIEQNGKFTTYIKLDEHIIYEVTTNNKISSASKAGKWIKDNEQFIKDEEKRLTEETTTKQKEDYLLKINNHLIKDCEHKQIIMHQALKVINSQKIGDYEVYYLDATWSPNLPHIRISGSSYPVHICGKNLFVGTKVINLSIQQNLFEEHKKLIDAVIANSINEMIGYDNLQTEKMQGKVNPFKTEWVYLCDYNTMTYFPLITKSKLKRITNE